MNARASCLIYLLSFLAIVFWLVVYIYNYDCISVAIYAYGVLDNFFYFCYYTLLENSIIIIRRKRWSRADNRYIYALHLLRYIVLVKGKYNFPRPFDELGR